MGKVSQINPITGETSTIKMKGSSNRANFLQQERMNRFNYLLAQQQNQWNIDQWNRENEYNSPSNQIALLKAAGLNPNLYQNNGATSSHLESVDMANMKTGNPMTDQYLNAMQMGMQQYNATLDRQLQQKQIDLEKKKVDLDSARVDNERKKVNSDVELNDVLKSKYGVDAKLTEEQAATQRKTQEEIDKRLSVMQEQFNNLKKQNEYFDRDKAWEYIKNELQSKEMRSTIQKIAEETKMTTEQIFNVMLEGTNLQLEALQRGQTIDYNQSMNQLLIQSKEIQNAVDRFKQEHQNADWIFQKVSDVTNLTLDAFSTITTRGLSRMNFFGNNSNGGNKPHFGTNTSYRNPALNKDFTSEFQSRVGQW